MSAVRKLLLVLLLVVPLPLALGASSGSAADPEAPPPHTIVSITGDAFNGFEIRYFDGSEEFPPTDSEARAECGEYDTRVARVRCRTAVRTWYRDLTATQLALEWAGWVPPEDNNNSNT